jgi:hypothetical protein
VSVSCIFFFTACSDSVAKESNQESNSETKSTPVQASDSVKKKTTSVGPNGTSVKTKNTDVQANSSGVKVGATNVKVDVRHGNNFFNFNC